MLNATIRKHLSLLKNDEYDLKKGLYIDNLIHTEQIKDNLIQFFHESSRNLAEAYCSLRNGYLTAQGYKP